MPNLASINLIGHLGRDAEVKRTAAGKVVVSFSVAVSRKRGGEEATTWWRCQFWGDRALNVATYLTKGKAVAIVGEAYAREYDANDGTKKQSLEVDVRELVLLGDRSEAHTEAPAPVRKAADPVAEEGIPF